MESNAISVHRPSDVTLRAAGGGGATRAATRAATHPLLVPAAVASIVAASAAAATIGADARWLAALGRIILATHAVPSNVPFAAAPSHGWANVPVLAELVFSWLQRLSDRGLLLAQVVAVGAAFAILGRDARARGTDAARTAAVLLVVAVGAFPSLAVIRAQLFSLVLFPLLVALLRREHRSPSRRIWLVLPLLALWSNLHGAVLVGLLVTYGYLVLSRARRTPATAAGVAVLAPLAICATPALLRTPSYYHGVLTNAAAARGVGLWAPLSPARPFDVLLAAVGLALIVAAIRRGAAAWELGVVAMLVVATAHSGRSGTWLLFFLAPLAGARATTRFSGRAIVAAVAIPVALAVTIAAFVRGPASTGASAALVTRAISVAHGGPILAEDALAEQVALAGGTTWIGNPLDAFRRRDQDVYLDWLAGDRAGRAALAEPVAAVLVRRGSRAASLVARERSFVETDSDPTALLFVRR